MSHILVLHMDKTSPPSSIESPNEVTIGKNKQWSVDLLLSPASLEQLITILNIIIWPCIEYTLYATPFLSRISIELTNYSSNSQKIYATLSLTPPTLL